MEKISQLSYEPSSIVNILRNSYFIDEFKGTISIKGIYRKSITQNESKNGYYYDSLQDENDRNFNITIRILDKFRNKLTNGKSYIFKGYLNRTVASDATIRTILTVSCENYNELGYYYTDSYNEEFKIKNYKKDKGFKSVDFFLENKLYTKDNPSILIITGNSSKALEDIYATLNEDINYFHIQEHHINITSKEEIKNSLSQVNGKGWDIVLLTRGGGNMVDLDVFNDTEISKVAVNLEPALVTAIGHSSDSSLLQEVSDRDFNTPTSFANYLKDVVLRVFDRNIVENDLQIQIDFLEQKQKEIIKKYQKKSLALLILGLAIGLILHKLI